MKNEAKEINEHFIKVNKKILEELEQGLMVASVQAIKDEMKENNGRSEEGTTD